MKKVLKILIIFILSITPISAASAREDYTEEYRNEVFENEIALNAQPDLSHSMIEKISLSHDESSYAIDTSLPTAESFPNKSYKYTWRDLFDFDGDIDDDGILDNTELDFEIFKNFDRDIVLSEDSLFGKIYHSKITRTDIPSYLLQDDLTFKFEDHFVSKIQAYAGFRGSLNSIWANNDYSTEYDNLTTQLGVYGQFKNPEYRFKLAVNPIPKSGTNYIDRFISDAYIVNTSIPNHQIVTGYSRVQTGVEGGTSSYILPFVTRSQIARTFGSARSLAVKVIGNYQYVDYNFSVGSAGRYITSGLPGAEVNAWVNLKPLGNKSKKYGKVTIGGGYNGGHNGIDYSIGSAYIAYHHKKLWTNFEAGIADGYNGSKGPSSKEACGYAFTLGWKFNPHVQLIGRVDQFDPNMHASNDLRREYTMGVNWFIKGQALKLILNYVYCHNQSMPNGHKLIVATQVMI